MKKCPYNVSSKSYDKFVKRIESVIADEDARKRMISAMQLYLAGYTDSCMEHLDEACRMAFEFLRFELDEAMRRSVRARERARRRKAAAEGEVCQASPTPSADGVPAPSVRRRQYAEAIAGSLEAYARAAGRELPAGAVEALEKEIAALPVRKSRRQRRAETRRAGAGKTKAKARWRAIG